MLMSNLLSQGINAMEQNKNSVSAERVGAKCECFWATFEIRKLQHREIFAEIRSYLDAGQCIPDKANFKAKHSFDSELYKQRNLVERFFQRIKNYRHLATRYDKLSFCFLNFVLLASSVIHL